VGAAAKTWTSAVSLGMALLGSINPRIIHTRLVRRLAARSHLRHEARADAPPLRRLVARSPTGAQVPRVSRRRTHSNECGASPHSQRAAVSASIRTAGGREVRLDLPTQRSSSDDSPGSRAARSSAYSSITRWSAGSAVTSGMSSNAAPKYTP
jgi:hypothetical protein